MKNKSYLGILVFFILMVSVLLISTNTVSGARDRCLGDHIGRGEIHHEVICGEYWDCTGVCGDTARSNFDSCCAPYNSVGDVCGKECGEEWNTWGSGRYMERCVGDCKANAEAAIKIVIDDIKNTISGLPSSSEDEGDCLDKCRDMEHRGGTRSMCYDTCENYDWDQGESDIITTPSEAASVEEVKPKLVPITFDEPFRTLKLSKGQVEMLRDGKVTPITENTEFQAGDVIHTGDDGSVEIATEEGTVKIGKDTTVKFIGLDFDPVPDRRIVPPPAAPWAPDPGSFKTPDTPFWKGVADDMVEHVPKVVSACMASLAGLPNPLDPGIPSPSRAITCVKKPIMYLIDGSLWSKTDPSKEITPYGIYTQTHAINHISTEFIVEVSDGVTKVTTLDGSVLVTDLDSGDSVVVDVNNQITVSESEPQQATTIDPESLDSWWIELTEEEIIEKKVEDWMKDKMLPFFSILLIIMVTIVAITFILIKKSAKPKTKAWGTTSLIFAIFGILFVGAPYFGLPLSIAAIWFSRIQKKLNPTNVTKAGFVLGILGTLLNLLIAFFIVMIVVSLKTNGV